jgi:hypothetical protein
MTTVFAVVGMLLLFNFKPAFSVSMAVFSHSKETLSSSDLGVTELDSKLGSKIKGGMYIQVTAADTISDIFTRPFEHQVEIDANQIFPNETLKREIINKSGSFEFTIPNLNYSLLGFNISASDVKVNASAKQVMDDSGQSNKTRIDFPVMLARSVNVSNEMISQKYENVDLSSIYAFYDPETDKFTFHVPYEIAARYLLNGS